jgi:hypothetical protein
VVYGNVHYNFSDILRINAQLSVVQGLEEYYDN